MFPTAHSVAARYTFVSARNFEKSSTSTASSVNQANITDLSLSFFKKASQPAKSILLEPIIVRQHVFNIPMSRCAAGNPNYMEVGARATKEQVTAGAWKSVCVSRIHGAIQGVQSQREMGGDAVWGCGPNSAARAAEMLGRPIGNRKYFIEHCPRSFTLPLSVPTPWPKVGPDPEALTSYLWKCSEFTDFWPRLTKEDNWDDMMRHFRHHLEGGRPMIVLLSLGKALQHYVCLIGLNEAQSRAALLDTSGLIIILSLDNLKHSMNAMDTWGHFGGKFSRYNGIRFDNAVDRPRDYYLNAMNDMRSQQEPLLPHPKFPQPQDPGDCVRNHGCVIA
jgi:hypothetical protein